MPNIHIAKYECMENDFCVVDQDRNPMAWTKRRVTHVCHRRRGVGSDGLVILGAITPSSVRFRLFNADGSGAEWSGNGVRCAAAFLQDRYGMTEFVMKTGAGPIPVSCQTKKGRRTIVSNTCSVPVVEPAVDAVKIRLRGAHGPYAVDAGNPHWVYLVPGFNFDWEEIGKRSQDKTPATRGVNVEFVRIIDRKHIEMRLFERGVGPTPSSGSGALAGSFACRHQNLIGPRVHVASPGGIQTADFVSSPGTVRMTAAANRVFAGEVALP